MKTRHLLTTAFTLVVLASCKKNNSNSENENNSNSLPVVRYEFANNLNDESGNSFNGNSDTAID